MGLTHLLDTNICVALLRGRSSRLRERIHQAEPGTLAISTVTLAELVLGCEKSSDPDKARPVLRKFALSFDVLPFDAVAAWEYGRVRAELEKAGLPIGPYDTMLAAQARRSGLTLVTDNTGEFSRVRGLKIENWLVM